METNEAWHNVSPAHRYKQWLQIFQSFQSNEASEFQNVTDTDMGRIEGTCVSRPLVTLFFTKKAEAPKLIRAWRVQKSQYKYKYK